MKKIILLAVVFMSLGAFAQAPLESGALQLNAGVGTSSHGVPVYLGLDYGVGSNFTIGAETSYQSHNNSSAFGLGANANYHFNKILDISSKWDLYAGLGLKYYSWSNSNNNNNYHSGINWGGQAGIRYFFTPKLGINAEFGGGSTTSGGKFGITYKL